MIMKIILNVFSEEKTRANLFPEKTKTCIYEIRNIITYRIGKYFSRTQDKAIFISDLRPKITPQNNPQYNTSLLLY